MEQRVNSLCSTRVLAWITILPRSYEIKPFMMCLGAPSEVRAPQRILGFVVVCAFVYHRHYYLVTSLPLTQYSLNCALPGQST